MNTSTRQTKFRGHTLETYREAPGRYCARIIEGPTCNNTLLW